jgi:small subunit ribosomal protein S7
MRGKKAKIRQIKPDVKFGSEVVARFIKKIMLHGKKNIAEKVVYTVIEAGSKELNVEPLVFVNTAVDNLRPALETKSRRVGGANYQVPQPVTPRRQEALAIRWIVDAARAKSGDNFDVLLRKEMVDAYNRLGSAWEKKMNIEKMAEANKAFAHFKW